MTDRKAVVFGLDGACFDLIDPWLDSLPTLQSLIDSGGRSQLESCVPATTPPAWTTLTTGVNPGKHGVFGFYDRHRDSYDLSPVSDQSVHARRLWDYTTTAGLTSLVVNVPVTHPARSLDGALVPGYLAPDRPVTFPRSLLEDSGHENYRVYAPSEAESVSDDQLLSEWLSLTRSRADVATTLIDGYDWDLLFLEFQKTDGAVHKFDDRETVKKLYECVDACMQTVLERIDDPVNVFVVSDHGIGQRKPWAVALNTWLKDEGYLTTTTDGEKQRGDWLDGAMANSSGSDVNKKSAIATSLATLGITRQRIERTLSAVGLYDIARRVAPDMLKAAVGEETVNRAESDAFYESMGFSGVDTGVLLNDAAFYEDGLLNRDEYKQLRETLLSELRELEGPDGNAFSQVRPCEEVYCGEHTNKAPDIVLEQAPNYVIGSVRPRGKQFIQTEPGRIDHTRSGLLIAAGPDIVCDWSVTDPPAIADVTPTLLSLLECPLNERFDGRALTSLFSVDRTPVTRSYGAYEPSMEYNFSDDERSLLEDRLQQMGYLE